MRRLRDKCHCGAYARREHWIDVSTSDGRKARIHACSKKCLRKSLKALEGRPFQESSASPGPKHVCGPVFKWVYGPPGSEPHALLVCQECGKRAGFMDETWDTSVVGRVVDLRKKLLA